MERGIRMNSVLDAGMVPTWHADMGERSEGDYAMIKSVMPSERQKEDSWK